jgi:hypothetical protein
MNRSYLPHIDLIDKLQLGALQLSKELAIVKSMLNWSKDLKELHQPKSLAWMLSGQALLTSPPLQVEKIKMIREEILDLGCTLKELMQHILEFSSFKNIEKTLIEMQKSYNEIPQIEHEINLIAFGEDLLESLGVIEKLIDYIAKAQKVVEHTNQLKKHLLENIISNLAFSLEKEKRALSRDELFKIHPDN